MSCVHATNEYAILISTQYTFIYIAARGTRNIKFNDKFPKVEVAQNTQLIKVPLYVAHGCSSDRCTAYSSLCINSTQCPS